MPRDASELARRLARDAEAVCRHYLSKGRRQGRYWMVGDVRNTPGRSMYVRLSGPESGPGAAGRWSDAASAEHGDLLDVIRESCGLMEFREVAEEARTIDLGNDVYRGPVMVIDDEGNVVRVVPGQSGEEPETGLRSGEAPARADSAITITIGSRR